MTESGSYIWIGNGNSVVRLKTTNSTFTSITNSSCTSCHFSGVAGVTTNGVDVWAADSSSNKITEFNATTGAFVHLYSAAYYDFKIPSDITNNGTDIWVVNQGAGSTPASVTEFPISSYLVATNVHVGYGFNSPSSIAVAGTHVWVANNGAHTITQFSVPTGSPTTLTTPNFPDSLTTNGTYLWATQHNEVRQFTIGSGGATYLQSIVYVATVNFINISNHGGYVWMEGNNAKTPIFAKFTVTGGTPTKSGPFSY
jgi:hypothetical protein